MNPTPEQLARCIDHTLLRPDAGETDIARLCEEAAANAFWSVCILPARLPLARKLLAGTGVKLCTVIGFPLGGNASAVKAFEAEQAVEAGAHELDMVIDIAALKDDDLPRLRRDIAAVVAAADRRSVKVIIETCLLDETQKRVACTAAIEAGADFVKTSTGFAGGGATVADVALMREVVGPEPGVKASGGIRSREDAIAMLEAGATRLGTSAGLAIIGAGGVAGAY